MARHYELLGIPRIASAERLKRSYRNLVKIYHPDRFPSGSKAHAEAEKRKRDQHRVRGALETQSRANYDATLQEQTFSRPGPEPERCTRCGKPTGYWDTFRKGGFCHACRHGTQRASTRSRRSQRISKSHCSMGETGLQACNAALPCDSFSPRHLSGRSRPH